MHINLLLTDWLVWAFLLLGILCFIFAAKQPHWRETWQRLLKNRAAMISLVVLGFYFVIGLLDSVHFQNGPVVFSLLDWLISPLQHLDEKTYSAPFATHLFSLHEPTRLQYVALDISSDSQHQHDIMRRIIVGVCGGLVSALILIFVSLLIVTRGNFGTDLKKLYCGKTQNAWRAAVITFVLIWIIIWICVVLGLNYHIFGTDKVGRDVFYEAVKSVRTGLLIGTLTTVFMLPLAILFGLTAGFFGGFIDDIIQYVYTTLSSIPGVLLISASVLVMQTYIAAHPDLFPTLAQRADARLLALCFILGITSWASLCRLLRAETLKLRDLEYIQAAKVLGVSRFAILYRHLLPNVIHIILITIVLDFSGLVLAEAVLSYVGVGVDPTTMSWGNMINSSRLELAREPIVWWPLFASLIFMFGLVLSANLLSDALRDALDPRLKE